MTNGGQARARLGVLAVVAAATGGACVAVEPAPNGVGSIRLGFVPPAIALGDSLRDTLGHALQVHGIAYDASGRVVPTAQFRYSYVPYTPDTAVGAAADTALVVDGATGAVRATAKWLKYGDSVGISSGRVFARIGSTLEVADTIQIVPPPNALTDSVPTDTLLRYDCRDPRTTAVPDTTPAFRFRNTAGPFKVTLLGDSLGKQVNVRRWLVRWSIDSIVPAIKVPTDSLTPSIRVPAIRIIANGADQLIGYDTTDASGTSNVRLRIRPSLLGPPAFADTSFRVVLRADVIGGAGIPVTGSPVRGVFAVRLSRVASSSCSQ